MNLGLVGLAAAMGVVTYASRALPLLAPGIERLPTAVLLYLRLVGPAVLAALAGVNALVVTDADRRSHLEIGLVLVAVLASLVVTAWRRSLLFGLVVGVGLTAIVRAVG